MARHGYVEDDGLDQKDLAMWRGRVASAMRGKRGQAMLRELAASLDAMPEKRLVSGSLQRSDGDCCAIGAVCKARGIDLTNHQDDDEHDLFELNQSLAEQLNVAKCMIQEIEYINDECGPHNQTPEQRWERVRTWVQRRIDDAQHKETNG